MNTLYSFLITLIIYPLLGSLLFAFMGKTDIAIKAKVLILSIGHPILAAIILWFGCSAFSIEIAKVAVLFVAGALIGTLFSSRKYFDSLNKETEILVIGYITPLLRKRVIKIPFSDIQELKQSKASNLISKPSTLTISLAHKVFEIDILDKTILNLNLS